MSTYLFTICGRAGSKGIKGKNFSNFLDIPLVYYTLASIELYREAHADKDVVLALNTDSPELATLVDRSGVDYVFVERKAALAGDTVGKVDVIRDTYKQVVERSGKRIDMTVDFDITSPLRTVSDVENIIARRLESTAGVVFTVASARRNPWFNMVKVDAAGNCTKVIESNYTARQQAPTVYDMNASLYAYSNEFMEGSGGIFDWPCDITVMRDTAVLDLDNAGDLELMQAVARYLYDTDDALSVVQKKAAQLSKGAVTMGYGEVQGGMQQPELTADWVDNQLAQFGGGDVSPYFEEAYDRTLHCLSSCTNKYVRSGVIDPLHTAQYGIYLYWLSRTAYEHGDSLTATKVYALNKALHGFDVFYEVELPEIFYMEHPVGTVLGRATYSNRLLVAQNVTVGGKRGVYPTIGENVCLHAGCTVVGNTHIGDNVEISAGAFVRDEEIPSNCLVFGQTPQLVVVPREYDEMRRRLYVFSYDEEA
jgi:CMP-N,N'-diacetyllegionaminic acid synthase